MIKYATFLLIALSLNAADAFVAMPTENSSAGGEKSLNDHASEKRRAILDNRRSMAQRQVLAALFAKKNDDEIQREIIPALMSQFETPRWRIELATEMQVAAFQARAMGNLPAARKAALISLTNLEAAESAPNGTSDMLAEIYTMKATLTEEFLGTSGDAVRYLKKASEHSPSDKNLRDRFLESERRLTQSMGGLEGVKEEASVR